MNKRKLKKRRKKLIKDYMDAISIHSGIPIDVLTGVEAGIRTI